MSQRHLFIAGAIIAVVIVAGFFISVPHTTREIIPEMQKEVISTPSVVLRDGYKNGLHTIRGSFVAPTACTTASTTARISEDTEDTLSKIVVTITFPIDTQVCLQLPTTVQFSTTLAAPADLPIIVEVNGLMATTSML